MLLCSILNYDDIVRIEWLLLETLSPWHGLTLLQLNSRIAHWWLLTYAISRTSLVDRNLITLIANKWLLLFIFSTHTLEVQFELSVNRVLFNSELNSPVIVLHLYQGLRTLITIINCSVWLTVVVCKRQLLGCSSKKEFRRSCGKKYPNTIVQFRTTTKQL